jgi:hypothetical protein
VDTSPRFRFLFLFCLLLFPQRAFPQRGQQAITTPGPSAGGGPWSVTSEATGNGNQFSTGQTVTALTVSAGDTIIVTSNGWTGFGSVSSMTPSGGTCGAAFSAAIVSNNGGSGADSEIWAAPNCQASVTGVTINFPGGGTKIVSATSVSGLASTIITDGTNSSHGSSSGNPVAGPSVTTAKSGDFIVSAFAPAHSVSNTAPTGWTMTCPACASVGSAYLTSNSAAPGSYAPTSWTLSSSGAWDAVTAAFATH